MFKKVDYRLNFASVQRYAALRYSLIAYLLTTLLLYFFGPVPWIVVSPFSLGVILISYFAFGLGSRLKRNATIYRFSFNSGRIQFSNRSKFASGPLLIASVWLILFIRNSIYFSNPVPLPSVILTSYKLLKDIESEILVFAYLNFLLAPLLLWSLSAVSVWKPRRTLDRSLRVLTLFFYFYSTLILGSGQALVEVVILFGLIYFRENRIRRRVILWVSLFSIALAFALSLLILSRLGEIEKITLPIIPSQGTFFEQPVEDANFPKFTAVIISFYLTNGYQGFQFGADQTPDAMYLPLASSFFMQRQYERYGLLPDGFERLELKIEHTDAWPSGLLWTTSFLWLRENIPTMLLPLFCFFLGKLYSKVILGFLFFSTPFRLAQAMLMTKIILFLPLNAISLATGDELVRTLIFIIIPGILMLLGSIRRFG